MNYKKYILNTLVIAATVLACNDPYNDAVDPSKTDYVTNDNEHEPTALDTWLLDNFTYPYNIEVKYRWDPSEGNIYRTLVPPAAEKVQPVMEVVKQVWIDTYADMAGETFIKNYCPKQFLMIGSARYNLDGSFTLGTAEGGRKVVLYVVNQFEQSDRYSVERLMHIVHHEFAHILHQNISYPPEFKEITPGAYTSDWSFFTLGAARSAGFITNYAMASPDEDFVEMIATMLIEGRQGYERILDCQTNATSRAILRRKEELVVQYYKDAFGIDFYALQTSVQEALNLIAPEDDDDGEELPPLFDQLGPDKEYTAVRFDLAALNEPADFVYRYNYDNTILHNAGYALDYNFKVFFFSELGQENMGLRLYYYELADETKTYQQANLYFSVERHADGTVSLYLSWGDDNGRYLVNELDADALAAFFANRTFTIDWLTTCSGDVFVGFIPQDSPGNYCFGILEP